MIGSLVLAVSVQFHGVESCFFGPVSGVGIGLNDVQNVFFRKFAGFFVAGDARNL